MTVSICAAKLKEIESVCGKPLGAVPAFNVLYGMTRREYLAAVAMNGILSGREAGARLGVKSVAVDAVGYTDALIAELLRTDEAANAEHLDKIVGGTQ